ncbi:MAG: hypothetical protein JW981_01680, partial [Anaerolineae bacterium]|nr:hypothetical protein [Anaerolineae bacterium]
MSLDMVLALGAYGILLVVSLLTSGDYAIHRDKPRRDIAIMFGALGIVALGRLLSLFLEWPFQGRDFLVFVAVLSHPYLLLRLARHFYTIPKLIHRLIVAGLCVIMVVSAFVLLPLNLNPLDSFLIFPAFAYVFIVESYTGYLFFRGAQNCAGLTQRRMVFVVQGAVTLLLVFILLFTASFYPAYRNASWFLLLLGGLILLTVSGYVMAFASPPQLKWSWQMRELHRFLEALMDQETVTNSESVFRLLCKSTINAVGGVVSVVALWNNHKECLELQPLAEYPDLRKSVGCQPESIVAQSWKAFRPRAFLSPDLFDTELAQLAKIFGANALYILPIGAVNRSFGLLLVFLPHSLFPSDDLALLSLFAGQSAVALSYSELLSNQRLLTEELQEARDHLEMRVQQRTAELQRANKELQQFTYIVSHDLRAPVVNLQGFSDELNFALNELKPLIEPLIPQLQPSEQETVRLAFSEDIPEAVEFIRSSVLRMDRLISALLQLSRLGRRELNLQELDMGSLVQSSLDALAHEIETKRIEITMNSLPAVYADRIAMDQIISNLLVNAVKYLSPDRPGKIHIYAEQDAEQTTFHIQDNGRGIAQQDEDKIFAPFRRAGR